MLLQELLLNIYPHSLPWELGHIDVQEIIVDSRLVHPQCLFVAIEGPHHNGADFIPEVIGKGGRVVVLHGHGGVDRDEDGTFFLKVSNTTQFLQEVAVRFYGYPALSVALWGITGTNGKTTTSYLIESVLKKAAKQCAVIGTVNYRIADKVIIPKNTTPGVIDTQQYLSEVKRKGIGYCIMEISSHALDQGRVVISDFQSAVFTNLTRDHLDYHGDMESYFEAKSKLFSGLCRKSKAFINADDPWAEKLISMTPCDCVTYGIEKQADVQAKNICLSLLGATFQIHWPQGESEIKTPLIGRHNIYNILAAWSVCWANQISPESIKEGIKALLNVPGRLEKIDAGQDFFVFVDYAHTDDALRNVLTSLKTVSSSRVILVFGCGGDRDKTKRPQMGKVASQLADYSIVTSDNPRSEEPKAIVEDIISGFKENHYEVILDRKSAIERAFRLAQKGEIVLIAGKGHEDYQVFRNKTISFSDRKVAKDCLECLA